MTIYYAQPAKGGLIKIGFTTKDVKSRINELQTGCPDKLVVLATEEGGEKREAELHNQFQDLREIGEWFRPDPRLMRHIFAPKIDINVVRLQSHATSYTNCLWSHCVYDGVDKPLVDLLFNHANYVAGNAEECWEFLKERGVQEVCWKHCPYFFSICWPIYEPWMELNKHVIRKVIAEPIVLPFNSMESQTRPIGRAIALAAHTGLNEETKDALRRLYAFRQSQLADEMIQQSSNVGANL